MPLFFLSYSFIKKLFYNVVHISSAMSAFLHDEIIVEGVNSMQNVKIEDYYHHDGEQLDFSYQNTG